MKKFICFILTAILLISVAACSKSSSNAPEDVIKDFEKALNRRDANLLHSIAADPIHQKESGNVPDSAKKYEEYLENMEALYGKDYNISIEIQNIEQTSNDSATASLIIKEKSRGISQEQFETFKIVKIYGKWYWED